MSNPVNAYALGKPFIHHKLYEKNLFELNIQAVFYGDDKNGATHEYHDKLIQDISNIVCFNSDTIQKHFTAI